MFADCGEDPLLPELRDVLANVRATLADLHTRVRALEPDLDYLPEPDEQTAAPEDGVIGAGTSPAKSGQ